MSKDVKNIEVLIRTKGGREHFIMITKNELENEYADGFNNLSKLSSLSFIVQHSDRVVFLSIMPSEIESISVTTLNKDYPEEE